MQLIRQLKDEELTDLLLEDEERDVQSLFAGVPQSLRSATERPGWFWQKQLSAVRVRVAASQHLLFRTDVAWSAAAVALLLLAFSLPKNGPSAKPVQGQTDSDQELLVAVEQAVETEGPESLEPAALLADEISNAQTTSNPRHVIKEKQHEN
jgi:hypothetical protein